jgi:hypothetical protein
MRKFKKRARKLRHLFLDITIYQWKDNDIQPSASSRQDGYRSLQRKRVFQVPDSKALLRKCFISKHLP